MKAWIDKKAILTVDAGSGWMSRYELEQLSAGSIVRSSAEAGTGCVVRLNGEFFATASVLVAEGNAGNESDLRLCALFDNFDERADFSPRLRRFEKATDLLPFAVRLGRVEVPLSSLEGTGIGSVVNLDHPRSVDADAELVVAGIPVASGKVSVIGENMGLRVIRFLSALPNGSLPRTTGSVLAPGYRAEKVADYDFTRPDRFTRRAIERSRDIHLDFLRGWQSRFPESGEWHLSCVDQLNYGEWLDDPARPLGPFVAFRSAERARDYERESSAILPETFLIESDNASLPFDRQTTDGIRAWISIRRENRDLLPFLIALNGESAKILDIDPHFDVVLACLRSSWFSIADLRIGQGAGARESVISKVPERPDECVRSFMILLVRIESASGGKIDIVYPDDLLEPYLPSLGR